MSYPYQRQCEKPTDWMRQYVPAPYFIIKAKYGNSEAKKFIMKKLFLLTGLVLSMVSCHTITKTSKTVESPASLLSATVADLEVSPERIIFTSSPSPSVRRGGMENVKQAAIQEALLQNGNADVLVDATYSITTTRFLCFDWVSSITVSGRPATYKNFHSLNDSVWCNPFFRHHYKNSAKEEDRLLDSLLK